MLKFLVVVVLVLTFGGCASSRDSGRPSVYRGGQYYEDAVHGTR